MRAARVAIKEPTSRHVPFYRRTMFIDSISAKSSICIVIVMYETERSHRVAATARDIVYLGVGRRMLTLPIPRNTQNLVFVKREIMRRSKPRRLQRTTTNRLRLENTFIQNIHTARHTHAHQSEPFSFACANDSASSGMVQPNKRVCVCLSFDIVPWCIHFGFLVRSIRS